MRSTDDFYKKLIKPIRDDYISNCIKSIDIEEICPYDKNLNWAERVIPIKVLREKFTAWSKQWLSGLESFPHMYITNGNTDSLHIIFNRAKLMSWKKGDYSYYSHWHTARKKAHQELVTPDKTYDMVVSWPGYSNGDRTELDFALSCNPDRLHLDCAYLGLTSPMSLDVSIFETASFSFSKTLSIPYNRISIMFSKTEITENSLLNKLGYVNLSGVRLVNSLIDKIPLSYWWDNYSVKLDKLCNDNDLRKTNSILFAYEGDKRIGLAPYWKDNA